MTTFYVRPLGEQEPVTEHPTDGDAAHHAEEILPAQPLNPPLPVSKRRDWYAVKEIHEYIEAVIRRDAATIEAACEESLTGGEHGVMVIRYPDGTLMSAAVDPTVPYGMIHERTIGSTTPTVTRQ